VLAAAAKGTQKFYGCIWEKGENLDIYGRRIGIGRQAAPGEKLNSYQLQRRCGHSTIVVCKVDVPGRGSTVLRRFDVDASFEDKKGLTLLYCARNEGPEALPSCYSSDDVLG